MQEDRTAVIVPCFILSLYLAPDSTNRLHREQLVIAPQPVPLCEQDERRVSGLNMIWLLMMILTPFAARLLAGSGGFGVRFAFYALVQVIAAVCLMQMNRQIASHNLLRQDAPESARYPDYRPRLALIIMFLVSIPLAFVTPWAFALWVASPMFGRVLERLRAGGRHATNDVSYQNEIWGTCWGRATDLVQCAD